MDRPPGVHSSADQVRQSQCNAAMVLDRVSRNWHDLLMALWLSDIDRHLKKEDAGE